MSYKSDLLTQLENSQVGLPANLMRLALYTKAERRKAKSRVFNALALDIRENNIPWFNANKDIEYKTRNIKTYTGNTKTANELRFFLSYIRSTINKKMITLPCRFQILVKNGAHWTAVDFFINDTASVRALIVDAAGDRRYSDIIYTLNLIFGNPTIYVSESKIQNDKHNCAWFTLYHVYKLSEYADLFRYLDSHQSAMLHDVSGTYFNKSVYRFDSMQLPERLLVPMQSRMEIQGYLKSNPHMHTIPVQRNNTFDDILKNFREMPLNNSDRTIIANPVINEFAEKQKKYIKEAIISIPEETLKRIDHLHIINPALKFTKKSTLPNSKYTIHTGHNLTA